MNQVLHMSQTIDDFRNFLKPDQEIKQFSLMEAINKTLILVGDSLRLQNITIDTDAQEDLIVTGYQNEYCQVLLNIVNNARDIFGRAENSFTTYRNQTVQRRPQACGNHIG